MRRFVIQFFTFCLLITLLIVLTFSLSLTVNRPETVKILNPNTIDSADIIILGDSRADRQINPEIINDNLNLNCLNIAESSLDLFSLSRRLIQNHVKSHIRRKQILIISASSWQINDGSTGNGYFRKEAFNNLSLLEKFNLYSDNLKELILMNRKLIIDKEVNINFGNINRSLNSGFRNINCRDFDTTKMLLNHPWYRNIRTNGIKQELLKKGLINLNKLNCKIIIFNAPVYSKFKKYAKNNGVWEMENNFNNFIKSTIKSQKLSNLYFHDLRNLNGFEYNDYYDPQHFCVNGANKFTEKIISIFKLKNVGKGD